MSELAVRDILAPRNGEQWSAWDVRSRSVDIEPTLEGVLGIILSIATSRGSGPWAHGSIRSSAHLVAHTISDRRHKGHVLAPADSGTGPLRRLDVDEPLVSYYEDELFAADEAATVAFDYLHGGTQSWSYRRTGFRLIF